MTNTDYLYKRNRELYDEVNCIHFADKKLTYTVIENGYIVPADPHSMWSGGVFDENKKFIDGTAMHIGIGSAFPADESQIRFVDKTVIFMGLLFFNCWGHTITDELSRMWFIKYCNEYNTEFRDHEVVCIQPEKQRHKNALELLETLGIDGDMIHPVDRVTKYRKIIIPDQCFFNERCPEKLSERRFFTKEYRMLIEEIRAWGRSHKTSLPYDKVYYTYAKYTKNKTPKKNAYENKLEAFFEKLGYTIIVPEEHTFKEQLNILLNCTAFASTVGSASHNSAFMESGTSIYLLSRADYCNEYQLAINELWEQNVFLIDSQMSVLANAKLPWCGPYFYYISENLRKCFSVEQETCPGSIRQDVNDFKQYLSANKDCYQQAYDGIPEEYRLAIQCLIDNENRRFSVRIRTAYNGSKSFLRRGISFIKRKIS